MSDDTEQLRSELAKARADLARIRAAVEPLDLYFRSKHELGAVVQMSVDPRETFAMRNVLVEVGTAVGLVTAPTDAQIVDLMRQRGNGSREQPRTKMGIPVGLAWRGAALCESYAQAAWDRHHASEATS